MLLPEKPNFRSPNNTPNNNSFCAEKEAFSRSRIGREIAPGHIVLDRPAFFFTCGAIHFPDREALSALRSAFVADHGNPSANKDNSQVAESLVAYVQRLGEAYAANRLDRRPIMSLSEPNKYQRMLLHVSGEFGIPSDEAARLPQALSYAMRPWTIVVSEDLATRNGVARSELRWLEFVRRVGSLSTQESCVQSELFQRGSELVGEYLAANHNSFADAMRFVGLDSSRFSQLSLWYFQATPQELLTKQRSGPARVLAEDHLKRSLLCKGLVRDACAFHDGQGDSDSSAILARCCSAAQAVHSDACANVDSLLKAI